LISILAYASFLVIADDIAVGIPSTWAGSAEISDCWLRALTEGISSRLSGTIAHWSLGAVADGTGAARIRFTRVSTLDAASDCVWTLDKVRETCALGKAISIDRALSVRTTNVSVTWVIGRLALLSRRIAFKVGQTIAHDLSVNNAATAVRTTRVLRALLSLGNALVEGITGHVFGTHANGTAFVEFAESILTARIGHAGVQVSIAGSEWISTIAFRTCATHFMILNGALGIGTTIAWRCHASSVLTHL
jgi:hypothetical protein